jgi:hypothetical protein
MVTYTLAKLSRPIYNLYARLRNEIPFGAIFEKWITSLFMLFESKIIQDEVWEAITREPKKDFLVAFAVALQMKHEPVIVKLRTADEIENFLNKKIFAYTSDPTAEREYAYDLVFAANKIIEQNQAALSSLRTKLETETVIADDRAKRRVLYNSEVISQTLSNFISEICSIFARERSMPPYLSEEFIRLHLFLLDLSKTISSPSRTNEEQLLSMFSLVRNSVSTICWFVITETSRCMIKSRSWLANVISAQDAKRVDSYFDILNTLISCVSSLSQEFHKLEHQADSVPPLQGKTDLQIIQDEVSRLINQFNEINRAAEEQVRRVARSKPVSVKTTSALEAKIVPPATPSHFSPPQVISPSTSSGGSSNPPTSSHKQVSSFNFLKFTGKARQKDRGHKEDFESKSFK